MKNALLRHVEQKSLKKSLPTFRSGDTIRVHYKIQEGAEADKFRIQVYEGVVIRYRKGTTDSSFTVRKVSYGVGVERVFPTHSPFVDKVEIIATGTVRRARLFYLRNLFGKSARIKSRYLGKISTDLLTGTEAQDATGSVAEATVAE